MTDCHQNLPLHNYANQSTLVNEEQKQRRTIQEAQIKKTEDLEMRVKHQHEENLVEKAEIKSEIAALFEIMKKQQP